jgi:hypothetical protein
MNRMNRTVRLALSAAVVLAILAGGYAIVQGRLAAAILLGAGAAVLLRELTMP